MIIAKQKRMEDKLSRKLPTSSIVKNAILEVEFLYSVKPPSQAQSSM